MKKSWDRAGKEPRREAGCPPFAASSGRGGRRGGGAGVLRGTQHSKAKWGQRPETGVQRAGGEIVRVGGALLGHCFGQVTDLADFGSKDFIPTRVLHEGCGTDTLNRPAAELIPPEMVPLASVQFHVEFFSESMEWEGQSRCIRRDDAETINVIKHIDLRVYWWYLGPEARGVQVGHWMTSKFYNEYTARTKNLLRTN
ncbi:hypothetical protein FB45DRAFT_1105829 [Roridomyces roridus]|uniref:Uncharacterized protein n=1 Tax=Roridomyces roridus TaxID=1738132 RepID=A0AAD7BCJ0_9AGAR|nr:hypothetical protein FB45DRAFT_1105829 [Roridomyces roridus]